MENESKRPGWLRRLLPPLLVIIAGFSSCAGGVTLGLKAMANQLQTMVGPGGQVLEVRKPGRYLIYHEFQGMLGGRTYINPETLPGLTVEVFGPDGTPVTVNTDHRGARYGIGDRRGRSVGTFTAEQPGRYILRVAYEGVAEQPIVVMTVGPDPKPQVATIFALGALALLVSFVVTIWLLVRAFSRPRQPETALQGVGQ